MSNCKISVVIPVYNTKQFLRRCVDSVLQQTFTDFEIILVDDGSSDGSSAICDEYAAMHKNIFTYHQKNQGLALTRKNGVHYSSGDYVFFLDSDDWIEVGALSTLYTVAIGCHADCVCCQFKKVL